MRKSDDSLLSAKEIAGILGITVSTLRHYDDKGLLMPAQNIQKNKVTYPRYEPAQIAALKLIRLLRDVGVAVAEVRETAKERTPLRIVQLLEKYRRSLENTMRSIEAAYSTAAIYQGLITEGMKAMDAELYVAENPALKIILGEKNNFYGTDSYHREYTRFIRANHEPKLRATLPVGGFFENMDAYLRDPGRPTRFFSFDPRGNHEVEKGLYLIGHNTGVYGETGDLHLRMEDYAKQNGLLFNGPVYNLFLFDEISVADPNRYLLRSAVSVRETRRI